MTLTTAPLMKHNFKLHHLRCQLTHNRTIPMSRLPFPPSMKHLISHPEAHACPQRRLSSTSCPACHSQNLGLEGCAGIIGGFFGILGVFGFLTFLWFGCELPSCPFLVYHSSFAKHTQAGSAPEAANATWVWRQLAIRNWMPQAITLASIVLRVVIGIQAIICTSMVAALLLERLSIPRSQVAHASVMRGINDGPWKLVMLLLSYKSKVSHVIWHPEAWLILWVALLSLALQFTSTILLSDMHSFVMTGDSNATTVNGISAYPGKGKFALF